MKDVKERVSDLEAILGSFIVQTEKAIIELKTEMKDFKDEMRQSKKELDKKWGELSNKLGSIAEDFAAPGVIGVLRKYFGLELDRLLHTGYMRNVKDRSEVKEFDVIAVVGDYLILCEIKSTVRDKYIQDFLELRQRIFDFWPEYAGKRLIPIFASFYIPQHMVELLTRHNVLAIAPGENNMDLLNPELVTYFQ